MGFLRKLFGGGGNDSSSQDRAGMYYYVRPRGCEEVVKVRIDRNNDLSRDDEGKNLFVQKTVRGTYRCFNPVELTLYFSEQRVMTNSEVSGGELVDEEAFDAWEEKLAAKRAAQAAPPPPAEPTDE